MVDYFSKWEERAASLNSTRAEGHLFGDWGEAGRSSADRSLVADGLKTSEDRDTSNSTV